MYIESINGIHYIMMGREVIAEFKTFRGAIDYVCKN